MKKKGSIVSLCKYTYFFLVLSFGDAHDLGNININLPSPADYDLNTSISMILRNSPKCTIGNAKKGSAYLNDNIPGVG